MDIKYCPECAADNTRNAKFCMSCRASFPDFSTIAKGSRVIPVPANIPVRSVRRPIRQDIQEVEDEDLEMPDDLKESDVEMSNILIDILEQGGDLKSNKRSVRFSDAIGNENPSNKIRRNPLISAPKNDKAAIKMGRDILRSTENRRNQK